MMSERVFADFESGKNHWVFSKKSFPGTSSTAHSAIFDMLILNFVVKRANVLIIICRYENMNLQILKVL